MKKAPDSSLKVIETKAFALGTTPCASGKGGGREMGGGVSVQSMVNISKDFCPDILNPFLENIDRRSCNDGNRELNMNDTEGIELN